MGTEGEFWHGASRNVFRITAAIYQGAYPEQDAAAYLKQLGVSAILNVSGGSADSAEGFTCLSVPFPDGQPIPDDAIERCLLFLDRCRASGHKVFVHCVAGQNRSPTIVWLYFIFGGMTPEQASTAFAGKTLDGVPGHPTLVGSAQLRLVEQLRRHHNETPQ